MTQRLAVMVAAHRVGDRRHLSSSPWFQNTFFFTNNGFCAIFHLLSSKPSCRAMEGLTTSLPRNEELV